MLLRRAMALLLGPLWAAAVVLAALGDRPAQGEWEIGLAGLAGAAALATHLDRLLGIASAGLDARFRRRITAMLPVAVALGVGLALGAGALLPEWTAASRLGSVAVGLLAGLASIAVGTRGGPVLFGITGGKRKDGWVALSWIAEDDALPALFVIGGLSLALSLEQGVAVLAGGGALAAAYWVGLRGELRRRTLARVRSRITGDVAWAFVPNGMSPLSWRLLVRDGDDVVETDIAAPSGNAGESRRHRAADCDDTVARALEPIGVRASSRALCVLSSAPSEKHDAVEVIELVHGPSDRAGPGRIGWKKGRTSASTTSD